MARYNVGQMAARDNVGQDKNKKLIFNFFYQNESA
jgi:hypothetical protein